MLAQKFLKLSIAALGLLIIFTSCGLPPYNEELSLAMLTTRKMKEEATVGPVKISSGPDFVAEELRFIPDKANLKLGFVMLEQEQEQPRLFFVRQDNQLFEDSTGTNAFDYNTGSDKYLNCQAVPVPAGTFLAHINTRQGFMPNQFEFNIFWFDAVTPDIFNTLTSVPITDNDGVLGAGSITSDFISANIQPDLNPAIDRIQFLLRNSSWPYLYHEVVWEINQAGYANSNIIRGVSTVILPAIGEGCFYYHDPSTGAGGTGIVSQYWQGRYLNYKWDDNNLNEPELLDIPYRIEALLTSSELFCRGDNMGMVYTQGGEEVSSFPMGALRFVYEIYDSASSAYKMIFVMPYSIGSHDDREIYFKVYSILTADIKELD